MNKKKSLIFLFLFIFLISPAFVSADSCSIVAKNSCSSPDNVIFELYSETNSHGAIKNSENTNYELCCDFAGGDTCIEGGTILKLSDTTNAHAEIASSTNYNVHICYGDLQCISTTTPSEFLIEYPITLVSLYSQTNSHIAEYDDLNYDYKILCKRTNGGGTSSNGMWMDYEGSFEIESINISQSGLGNPGLQTSVKLKVIDTGVAQGTSVTFEIYEKDDLSADDGIRTIDLGNPITGNVDANGNVIVTWTPTYEDINNSGLEQSYEYYFKTIINGEVTSYINKILNLMILWDWNGIDNCTWLDYDKSILPEFHLLIPAQYIFSPVPPIEQGFTTGTEVYANEVWLIYHSNLVHTNVEGIRGDIGTHVYFEILEKDRFTEDEIRVGENALIGKIEQGEISMAPWQISPEDLEKAGDEEIYNFYFRVTRWDGFGMSCLIDLYMRIDWGNITDDLTGHWANFLGNLITAITFQADNLGGTSSDLNTVKMIVDGFPTTNLEGEEVIFEIYEKDTNSYNNIRVGEKAITGIINSSGTAIGDWTVEVIDLYNAGGEGDEPWEFYFNISMANQEIKGFPEQLLTMTIEGDLPPLNPIFENAVGEWRDLLGQQQLDFWLYRDAQENKVSVYITGINAEEGTQIYVEIYEKDLLADDEILVGANAIPATVNNNGFAFALWDMTAEHMQAAGSGGTDSNPWEFYFNLVYGSEEKEFIDQILEVENRSAVIEDPECINIDFCSDYLNSVNCSEDECNVTILIPNIDCDANDITCYCEWDDTDGCSPAWRANATDPPAGGINIGSCSYQEDLNQDNCDDGFLSYSWTATWIWDGANSGKTTEAECLLINGGGATTGCVKDPPGTGLWYYDPLERNLLCVDGQNTIACPAQAQLSFGNWINWLFAVIIILIIYYLIHMLRKAKGKNTTKTKKKK